jgi:peptidoglycan/LPS O-acetylase OafA/YrhL
MQVTGSSTPSTSLLESPAVPQVDFPAANVPCEPDPSVPTTPAKFCDTYQPQFEGLRAIAVLSVLFDHFGAKIPNFPLPDAIHLGATGVRLFLVLSGFFITASLKRARDRIECGQTSPIPALGHFYKQRFLRILPPYGIFVGLGLLCGIAGISQNFGWLMTFTVNILIAWTDEWPEAISHLWSICVQEQFYLLWPALIFFMPKRWVLQSILVAASLGVVFRIGCILYEVPLTARWVLPFGSLDSLAAGAALGWIGVPSKRLKRGAEVGVNLTCVVMLVAAAYLRNSDPTRLVSVLVEPLEALAMVWLVARTMIGFEGWVARLLTWKPLLQAGKISYGIYIYHVLVAICFDEWLTENWRWMIDIPVMRLMTLTFSTIVFAAISWRLIEQPINLIRRQARSS